MAKQFDKCFEELDGDYVMDMHQEWRMSSLAGLSHGFWQEGQLLDSILEAKSSAFDQLHLSDYFQKIVEAGDHHQFYQETNELEKKNKAHKWWIHARTIAVNLFPVVVGFSGTLWLWFSVLGLSIQ